MQGYSGPQRDILIDVGTGDNFLEKQLKPEALENAAKANKALQCRVRLQVGHACMTTGHLRF